MHLGFSILLEEADFLKPDESRLALFDHLFFSLFVVFFFKIVCKYFDI